MRTEAEVFEYAVHVVMGNEGGYANDANDQGGETKYGISKRQYPDLNIRDLTREQAVAIYRKDYWEPGGFGHLQDLKVAAKIFDMAVNMGTSTAIRLLQRAVNYLVKRDVELLVDGVLGPKTAVMANARDPDLLVLALRAYHALWYVQLVEGPDTRYENFSRGWLQRAMS